MNNTLNNTQWLIRREFWENRAIWLVPAVIAGLLLLGAGFGHLQFGSELFSPDGPGEGVPAQVSLYALSGVVTSMFLVIMSVYAGWYLLDCLHADRKDRSILFWKSLPVSDTETVLVKLLVGLIILPLVYFAIADLTIFVMALILSLRTGAWAASGLWHPSLWLQTQGFWLYTIVTLAVWYLPVAGWLMLISAWATRAVILWSVLPPLAIFIGERWMFGTHYFGTELLDRLGKGYALRAFNVSQGGAGWTTAVIHDHGGDKPITYPVSLWHMLDPIGFFGSAATLIGAGVGCALIVAAIQLRSRRAEI
jgi:ABC-2 type transport system permease protein